MINFCPDKPGVLAEVFRLLRPGGRLQMADILLNEDGTPAEVERKRAWSDGIAGAVRERLLLSMLTEAGFAEPAFHGWRGYITWPYTQGGLVTARKPDGETAAGFVGLASGMARDMRAGL